MVNNTVDERLNAQSKQEIIDKLTAQDDFPLGAETLKAMSHDELNKLAKKFEKPQNTGYGMVDFSARAGAHVPEGSLNKEETASSMVMPAGVTFKKEQ